MGAIAIGSVAGLLAAAEPSGLGLFGGEDERFELSAFVLAVAKWLLLGQAASAVGILFTGVQGNLLRGVGSNFGQAHQHSLFGAIEIGCKAGCKSNGQSEEVPLVFQPVTRLVVVQPTVVGLKLPSAAPNSQSPAAGV